MTDAAEDNPVIRFERVSLSFPAAGSVLEDVSFTVARGETKVLLGESGSGKTVLMKLAMGLLRPTRGQVWLLGHEVSRMQERELFDLRRSIGMTFQESALFDSLSVRENIAFRLIEEGQLSEEQIDERVRTCLRFVGLESAIDKMPAELSGGMRHRVSIARALATSPEVMLYDSPTGGLDPETATTIVDLVIKLRDLNHVTALLATHRLQDGYLLATRVWDDAQESVRAVPLGAGRTSFLLLRDGRAWFDGSAAELLASHDEYLRNYLNWGPRLPPPPPEGGDVRPQG